MVVTRRAPLPPTPSSRSSSSQAIPRVAKVKVNQSNQPEHSSPLASAKPKSADTMASTITLKPKPKSKWRRKSSPKSKKGFFRRFVGFLFKAYLAWLAAYWFFICENPHLNSNSSVCRTIFAARDNVLEPYAYPIIKGVLSYPPVEPYVKQVEPYVIRVHHVLQPIAVTAASKFSTHVVPEWNHRVVPQYNAHLAPHIRKALAYLDPYLAVVGTEYDRYLAPCVHVGVSTAWKLQERVQPYAIIAWHKSVDGFRYTEPYVRSAWGRFEDLILRVLAYLAVYRRHLVDPHIIQMWAKIKELSGDRVVPSKTQSVVTPAPAPVGTPLEESSTVAAIFVEDDTRPPAPASTPVPLPILSDDEKMSPASDTTAVIPDAVDILGGGPADPTVLPIPAEPQAVVQEEERHTSNPNRQDRASAVPHAEGASIPSSAYVQEQATPAPSVIYEDEDDLELFSAEIGLDVDEPEDEAEEEAPSTPPEESEEEREAKLKARAEATAQKRREITDRHTNWEYQLEDLKREQMETFKLALYNVRKTSAKMLKNDPSIQRAIDEFAADGDRYLKGAENYLKNLVKEKRQDKSTLWERVVQKVEEKFEKRLDDVDRKVGDWYNGLTASEQELVQKATTPVAEFSQRAQADLGLDYSWLDDVTVQDWTRYHDLMRSSELFAEEVLMIRNGTHVEALHNPVFRALKELRVEVEDIITGFKSRLRRIQRDGERAFNTGEGPSEPESTEDPTMSILPITDEKQAPPVVIGKSSEQVEEALKEAPLEEWAASKLKKPDEVHTHEEL